MWAIVTQHEARDFDHSRALVSVYLSKGYDHEKTQWLLDAFQGFNRDAGHNWHLLVPCREDASGFDRKRVIDGKLDASLYDVDLARTIIKKVKLDKESFPILTFEDPNGEVRPYFISLAKLTTDEISSLLQSIAAITNEAAESGLRSPEGFRMQVFQGIERLVIKTWGRKIVVKFLELGNTLIGAASALLSFRT